MMYYLKNKQIIKSTSKLAEYPYFETYRFTSQIDLDIFEKAIHKWAEENKFRSMAVKIVKGSYASTLTLYSKNLGELLLFKLET
jgi:hypothetical protein